MALQTAQILMANLQAFCQRNVDNRLSADLCNSLLSLVKSNLDKLTEEVEKGKAMIVPNDALQQHDKVN